MTAKRWAAAGLLLVLATSAAPGSRVAKAQAPPQSVPETIQYHFDRAQKAQREANFILAESEWRAGLGLALVQLGLAYHTLSDLDKAEFAYRSAVEAVADSDVALLGLSIVYLRKGEAQKGIETVRAVLAQKPFHPVARHLLGKFYFSMNRFDAAALELQEAARLAPGDPSVAFTLAITYLKQRQLDKAKKIFAQMLSTLGESPQIHILFGGSFRETEFLNDAAHEFKRALELDPRYPRAHYYLGLTYLSQEGAQRIPEAIEEFQAELRRNPDEYLANYLLGLVYLHERRLEDAVPCFEKAARLDPEKPDAPLYLGQAYSLLGRHEKAVPALLKALELTKDPSRNQFQVANAHYLLGQAYRREGKMDEAQKQFALASSYKAKSAVQDQERLQLYLRSGEVGSQEFQNAVTSMEGKAIIVAPEPPDAKEQERLHKMEKFYAQVAATAYNQLGLLGAGQSDFRRAARNLERAAQWDPGISDLDYNLGLAQFKAQNYAKAIPPLEKVRAREPGRLPAQILLGLAYFYVEDYRRAAQQLEPIAASAGEDPQVVYALGLSLVYSGGRGRGEQILRELLTKHPEVAELHFALGQALAERGDYGDAGTEFLKALEINPGLPEAHYYAGLALLRQSKFVPASEEFRREIARDPRHAKAQYHLGLTLTLLGRVDEGVDRLEESTRLDPSYADAYYEIGKMRLKQGRVEEAITDLEKAVELVPNKSYMQYQLSKAYSKAGRNDAAEAALARYRGLKARERALHPESRQ